LEVFLDGLGFGESPRWHDGRLWFSDFIWHRVSSAGPAGDARVEVQLDDQPSGLGWLPDGRLLVVSMHKKHVLRHEGDGTLAVHADLSGIATGHGNDMVVNSDGTAYVGNFGSDLLAGEDARAAKLAIVRTDGTVSAGAEGLLVPNGSVITPGGETLIVGESYAQRYTAFPIAADGSLGASRLWADLGSGRNPDGCTLDAEGAIWFANCFGLEVVRVLQGGEVTDVIELPETPWACALGGDDGHTLFMIACPVFPTPDHQEPGRGRIWAARVDVPHAGLP
jgi:sugar lactone lactonase YvrE